MASAGARSGTSIRGQLGALLATLGVLVGGLLVVATLQLRASGLQARAENERNTSFRLADSMRTSSNDLTQMVRLYVATGDFRYRQYYDEILAIRSGTAPRPVGYDSSFWDRVLAEGKGFVTYGRAESLVSQMREANFTQSEFNALNGALAASDDLAKLELNVMDRVSPRIARGVDHAYLSDVAPEYQLLIDGAYLSEKGKIMSAIGGFIDQVEARTDRAVERAQSTSRTLSVVQIGILGAIVLVAVAAMIRASRVLLRPLAELAAATQQVAVGDYGRRVGIRGVHELEVLASTFNAMAGAIQSDVSRRELAEREAVQARGAAEEANQAKSTFVAAMSHEIRTPMIGVTGMLEVLAQTELSPEQESMVSTASGSANMLLQIIGDILDFSKIEAGRLELAPAPFMLRPLVESAVQTFFHTASAKGVRLTCAVGENVAPAHLGDALRLRQILSNFLSNAVKFTGSGTIALTVRVLADDGTSQTLEFSVADTGIGVAPDRQRELFEEYVQAEASTATRSGGTGLGLVICRRLAMLMAGDVRMESAPGEGTTMYLEVRLPVADARDVEAAVAAMGGASFLQKRPKPTREEAEREGSVLLLAEDHPINRRVLLHQLGIIGFHVDTADDGQKALDLFERGNYGLVLTDLNMPVMDGFELVRAIRRREAESCGAPTPIIALSANVMPEEAERCMAAGMDDFAGKPASMPVLAEKLRRWLPHIEWPSATTGGSPGPFRAETSIPDHGGVVDPAVLRELTGGDDELAEAILGDYVDSLGADVAALRAALERGDLDGVRHHAHRIGGSSRTVGTHEVTRVAETLEAAASASSGDWLSLRSTAEELDHAMERVAATVGRAPVPH